MSAVPGFGPIVAAIGFDPATDTVVAAALSCARRLGRPLRLVHAIDPACYELNVLDFSTTMYAYPPILLPTREELIAEAKGKLDALAAKLPKDVRVTTAAPCGPVPQALAADAVAGGSGLIVAGYDPDAYLALTQGFSTTLSLMHDAPLPVLAVCKSGGAPDFAKPGFRVLVADDLQPDTRAAVRTAYTLAARLGRSHVRQLHVHGDFREMLRDTWQELKGRVKAESPEALWVQELEARRAQLAEQGGPARADAEQAGVQVEVAVRTGGVVEELKDQVRDFSPDLLVFGRHRVARTRPFLIGRVTFRTMLSERRPVLLVPAEAACYEPRVFPV